MRTEQEAEAAGRDAAISGPNTANSHFTFFATPALTKAWERGNEGGRNALADWAGAKAK